jgi:glycosyltransferase involved in cell wall biosynthesis
MKVQANVMIQNEALILPHVYEYWKDYPIDKWVFYDDNSSDNTAEVIKSLFKDKSFVFEGKRAEFNESHNRSQMLEFSRDSGADFVLSIDADELLSTSWLENWESVTQNSSRFDVEYYWYNVVGTVRKIRQDPMYRNNYRTFLLPMSKTGKFDMTQYKYHTPRTPPVELEKATCKDAGVIHLQSINTRYYALKQLWYKHYEYKTWNHSTEFINNRYDPVVNNLNFMEQDTPEYIYSGIEFDASVYDQMEETKGYRKFILENYNEELVTFGKEYL